jgi:hypothetical protein
MNEYNKTAAIISLIQDNNSRITPTSRRRVDRACKTLGLTADERSQLLVWMLYETDSTEDSTEDKSC